MTHVEWANLYICANVLLALSLLLLAAIDRGAGMLRHPIACRHRLAIGHALVVAALLLPLAVLVSGQEEVLPRTAQVWSALTMNGGANNVAEDHRIAIAFAPGTASMSLSALTKTAAGLVMIGMLISLLRLGADVLATRRIIARAQTIRQHGRVCIRTSDEIQVPFSFWWPVRYFIVVPSALVLHPGDLTIAIRHEAQHHRQHDTKWLYVYQLIKALFFFNPAVHGLERHLRSLQEFACDEALTSRQSMVDADYCRSLLRVAEAAVAPRRGLVRASMLDDGGAGLLKRRVDAVLRRPAQHQRKPAVAACGLIALSLLVVMALGCSSTIRDQRISTEEAARMVAATRENTVPIAVNDRILRQLNLLLATPDGRAYVRASLDRMQSYEELISAELARRGLPAELLAVPLVESGYRNLDANAKPPHGAGLWQFIAPTAERFGLTVSETRDERLDVPAATRAAAQLFADLHNHFGDWGLAILAYNAGSTRVEAGIRATGSRNVWRLIEQGYENDRDYVARVIAAIVIMDNPSVLD